MYSWGGMANGGRVGAREKFESDVIIANATEILCEKEVCRYCDFFCVVRHASTCSLLFFPGSIPHGWAILSEKRLTTGSCTASGGM